LTWDEILKERHSFGNVAPFTFHRGQTTPLRPSGAKFRVHAAFGSFKMALSLPLERAIYPILRKTILLLYGNNDDDDMNYLLSLRAAKESKIMREE